MTGALQHQIDQLLAERLQGDAGPWPEAPGDSRAVELATERALYHGIAGLLAAAGGRMEGWPAALIAAMRREAVGRAMWELRHRQLLTRLLDDLDDRGHRALLIKGSAFAYDLYGEPAQRIRGDSDIWVERQHLEAVRGRLAALGFTVAGDAGEANLVPLQEVWLRTEPDGSVHAVDLHWSAINSAALRHLFSFADCWRRRRPLPRLGPSAFGLDHADSLLHSAVHRAMHLTSPYMVDGRTYYGGDRLLWAYDIHRLVVELGPEGLGDALARAGELGLQAPLGEALAAAMAWLGTPLDRAVLAELQRAPASVTSRYLECRQVGRAWLDLRAAGGLGGRGAAIVRRLFPSAGFLRSKYGPTGGRSLPLLYMRRLIEFILPRPGQGRS